MKNGLLSVFIVVFIQTSAFIIGCKPDDIEMSLSAASSPLVSVAITPSTPTMAPGTTLQLEAIGVFANNTARKLTQNVTWKSEGPGIATVNETGLVTSTPSSSGSTLITATSGSVTGSTVLTFSPVAAIAVKPADPSIAPGTTQQFTATGTLQNSASQDLTGVATWTSSDAGIAAIADNGFASAGTAATGASTITAEFSGVSGTTLLTSAAVTSIAVTPENSTIIQGQSQQFRAIGTLSNNATQNLTNFAAWNSLPPDVAVISNTGLALSIAPGSALITASVGTSSGSTVLTVAAPSVVSISITPVNQSVSPGASLQFTALATLSDGTVQDITADAAWISSDTAVATVSNIPGTEGLVTAHSAGTASISASFSGIASDQAVLTVTSQVNASFSIAITPSNPSIRTGSTIQFTAFSVSSTGAILEDVTSTAFWSSSNGAIASVSQGFATAQAPGTTTITATFGGISGSIVLTVTP